MKRTETSASTKVASASVATASVATASVATELAIATSGPIDAGHAVPASNDTGQDTAIKAADAIAICMANSTFGG